MRNFNSLSHAIRASTLVPKPETKFTLDWEIPENTFWIYNAGLLSNSTNAAPNAGTFKLSFGVLGETGTISSTATAAAVQTAIRALGGILSDVLVVRYGDTTTYGYCYEVSVCSILPTITENTLNRSSVARTPIVTNGIMLPLASTGVISCTVNWGDGSGVDIIDAYNNASRFHNFKKAGVYRIRISGKISWRAISGLYNIFYIKKIVSWGDIIDFQGFTLCITAFRESQISSLPSGGIIIDAACASISSPFAYCEKIVSIPVDFFDRATHLTSASLGYMPSVVVIPTGLLDKLTSATSFQGMFINCTKLTTIPESLFNQNAALGNNGLRQGFEGCTSLQSIPEDLFQPLIAKNNSYLFSGSFKGCTALTSIPAGLFANMSALTLNTVFEGTFEGCTSLTAIPAGLFDDLTAMTAFNSTFLNCTGLTTVPSGLFRLNTACLSFNATFKGCVKLQLESWVFYNDGEQATRFLNQRVVFTECFMITSFSGTQGTASDLWDVDFGTQTPTRTRCFNGHSAGSVDNYADIPTAWR